jgi:hypothetical protein
MSEVHDTFHREFTKACAADYPATDVMYPFRERVAPTLVSPYVMNLPDDIRRQAVSIVEAFFALRSAPEWQTRAVTQEPPLRDPGNTSALMSYDFHIDAAGALRLIEINTNASLSLITEVLHRFHSVENVFSTDFRREIIETFAREYRDALATRGSLKQIAIVDVEPLKQRLFIEFAMYQELFERNGWKTYFYDPSDLRCESHVLQSAGGPIDLVYNRDTDFYLTGVASEALQHAMVGNCAAISPHPFEYRLLADKDRLLELSSMKDWPVSLEHRAVIERALIRTVEVSSMDGEKLWSDRKHWFFKPRRSHGGKAVYRGSSTSRGTFASILKGDYLAQELVPPPVIKFEGEDEMKYDLRFYVYRDKIQLSCARLYRGQMTNSQSLGGGIAPIRWTV